jgi:hypothetical protein
MRSQGAGAGESLHVDYRKWPDSPHWQFPVVALGEDGHGQWFHVVPGTLLTRREHSVVQAHSSVLLLPPAGGWTAYWNSDPAQHFSIYVDVVATPAVLSPGRLTVVDLDLDVACRWSGEVEVLDEDEFLQHQVELAYPQDLIRHAEATTRWLVEQVTGRVEPFGTVGEAWLARVMREYPPCGG